MSRQRSSLRKGHGGVGLHWRRELSPRSACTHTDAVYGRRLGTEPGKQCRCLNAVRVSSPPLGPLHASKPHYLAVVKDSLIGCSSSRMDSREEFCEVRREVPAGEPADVETEPRQLADGEASSLAGAAIDVGSGRCLPSTAARATAVAAARMSPRSTRSCARLSFELKGAAGVRLSFPPAAGAVPRRVRAFSMAPTTSLSPPA
jgi:hypothetical protein